MGERERARESESERSRRRPHTAFATNRKRRCGLVETANQWVLSGVHGFKKNDRLWSDFILSVSLAGLDDFSVRSPCPALSQLLWDQHPCGESKVESIYAHHLLSSGFFRSKVDSFLSPIRYVNLRTRSTRLK